MKYEPTELGDVCDFLRGMTYKPADKLDKDQNQIDAIGVVRTANVQQRLEVDDLVLVPRRMLKSEEKLIREGDIIISSANSWNLVGKCCQAEQDFPDLTFGGFVTNMRPNPGKALPRYVYHFFSSPRVQHLVRSFGRQTTSISNLDLNRTKTLKIPLPPLEEQRRIAGILDAADALRRRRREALALLDTLPGALFAEMFGDIADLPSVPFGQVIHDIGNGVSPSRAGTVEDEVLTLSAVTGVRFDASKRKADKFAGAIPVGKRVETGDFLLCRGNGNPDLVGSGKLADNTGQGFVYPDTIMRAKLNEARVVPGYVASLWKHNHIRDQITAGARTTNGTMKINQTTVKNIEIPLPDLASQAEFARRASEIETGIKAQQIAHLSELEALFASLQSRAFAGEL